MRSNKFRFFFISSLSALIMSVSSAASAATDVLINDSDKPTEAPNLDKIKEDPRGKVLQELMQNSDNDIRNMGLVIDSSGSMGQILEKNKTKMFFLKKIMKGFVSEQWKLKNNIGVRVYGSQRKKDCDDINLAIPYSNKSLGQFERILEKMSPVGMTPLHKSIELTVEELKKTKGPKSVVIVTDGEDTCGGDPCKTAEKVKKDKLDIQFFVVALGFKGPTDEISKLKCLGDMSFANSESSLDQALKSISNKVGRSFQNLKVISPNPDSLVYLYRKENGKSTLVRVFYASAEQTVPEGTYEAVVLLNPAYRFSEFEIKEKRRTTLKVEGDGQVTVNYFGEHLRVQILDKNNKPVVKFKSDQVTTAPSGKWKLRIFRDPFFERIIPDYFVYPNGKHSFDMNGAGVLRIDTNQVQGLYVYDMENNLIDNGLTNTTIVIKTGTYVVHVDDQCSFDKVEIKDKREVLVLDCRKN